MWSIHRHFLFIIALVGMISFACRDERDEEVEPDADLSERWIHPTNMRLTAVDTVWKEEAVDCCMPFQIEHVEVKDNVLHVRVSYWGTKKSHEENDFKIIWTKETIGNFSDVLSVNLLLKEMVIGKLFRCKKSAGKDEKLIKELLKIDLLNSPLSLSKERLAHTHLEIRNGCLASIKADLQYYQEEVPQVIGKEIPTCQRGSYRILSADFDNHYLKVQVTYKGSRPHAFALIYPEVITMIHPPRFGIYLQHDDKGDQGTKTVLHTLKIDLSKNPLGFSAKLIAEAELTLINPCPPMQLFKEKPSQSHDPVLPFSPIPQVFGKSVSDYQSSPFHIDGAGFDGYILKIAVRYTSKSPYDFKLVYPENIITIYPPVFSVYLVANEKGNTGTNTTITETFLIDLRKNPHGFSEKVILESRITLVNASNVEQTFKNH